MINPTEGQRSRAATATVDYAEALSRLLPAKRTTRGALLPLLHALQDEYGYIDDQWVPHVAEALNLSRADVHGVVTFYHDFRRTAPSRHRIKICRSESCRARGSVAVERAIVAATGVAVDTASNDGALTVERIHCFGLCATGPNVMVDGRIRSRVDVAFLPAMSPSTTLFSTQRHLTSRATCALCKARRTMSG